ncbi:MAG: hypothetical protein C0402_02630 [Thermodesulfovibrio sp.]|nr:hypothetical protein [Thermodesulfovibrio sp.]
MNPVVRLKRQRTIVPGQSQQSAGGPAYVMKWAVMVLGPEPASFKRPVPETLIKKNIGINIRNTVHIGPGYHNQVRSTIQYKLRR